MNMSFTISPRIVRAAAFASALAFGGFSLAAGAQAQAPGVQDDGAARRGAHGRRGRHLTPEQRREHAAARLQRLADELGLSDAQRAQVREIFDARREARQNLRAQSEGRRGANREERQAIREAFRQQMQEVLTPEQAERFRALREARRAERGERRGARHAERFARMSERLGLSEAQQQAMREAFEARREASEALRAEAREAGPSEQRHQERQAIREAFRAQVREILTPEQLEQFREMRERRGRRGRGHRGGRGQAQR